MTMRHLNLGVLALLSACGHPDSITVKITGDAGVQLGALSRIGLTFWGYNQGVADVPATKLATKIADIPRLPASIDLDVPADGYKLITPIAPPAGEAKYYVSLLVDADGDGRVCGNDYRQDFDRTPSVFFQGIPTSPVEIALLKHDANCEPLQ